MGRLGAVAQALVLFHLGLCSAQRVRIDPTSGHFVGPDGRTRLFHGVNVVEKKFPWHPSLGDFDPRSSLNARDISDLKSWGMNAVRLGVMWPGVEPSPGQYNATYLKLMRQLVDDMYAQGVYTIVDFHQDAFTQRYCGEGFPDWLLPMLEPIKRDCGGVLPEVAKLIGECRAFASFNYTTDPATGFPRTQDCLSLGFDQYDRSPEVASAWGNFFAYESAQQKVQDFWRVVATALAGSAGVLAYDLVNEPLAGNFFADPDLLIPGHADLHLLQPMYARLHDVIRAVDPGGIMMYEPAPVPDSLPAWLPVAGGVHSSGFTAGPAGADVAHQAMSYHIYSCGFALAACDKRGDPASSDCDVCDKFATTAVTKRQEEVTKLGGAAFLTEFGACSGSETCIAEINRIADRADSALHSWAYWQFKYYHDITTVAGPEEGFYHADGSLQDGKVAALSRTYAPIIAGRPELVRYDAKTGAFRLRLSTDAATNHLPTEIYLNRKMNYPGQGFVVHALNATVEDQGDGPLLVTALARVPPGLQVDVVVTRPYSGPTSGTFAVANKDAIKWQVEESSSPGFGLSVSEKSKGWRALKVFSDDGKLICALETSKGGTVAQHCSLEGKDRHGFLFQYYVEIWKDGMMGRASRVDTIKSSVFGPLVGKQVTFSWGSGVVEQLAEMIV